MILNHEKTFESHEFCVSLPCFTKVIILNVGFQEERTGLQQGVTNTSFIIVPSNILVSCIQLKH